ncbi:MAG: transporter [Verrucomicrobia bacterium]|nr:transporter [Verrucomicrobiota bacterium]
MNIKLVSLCLGAGLFALPGNIQAQSVPIIGGHYPAGVEGIKGASLPPPGVYFRDYNIGYFADQFENGPPDFDISAYINAPRLIWITPYKILGADYGMDLIIPFGYMNWEYAGGAVKDHYFGLGDIQIEPLLLSWHFKQFDLAFGYAVWAPSGDFSPTRPDLLAKGYWSHMLTLGGTWYIDQEKTWAVSLLNRYEFAHEQTQTHTDPGQVYTIEWGISKSLSKTLDIGLIGYYQQQTTKDSGPMASNLRDRIVGLGAEINMFCPKMGMFTSIRYAGEFDAVQRPEGQLLAVTLTKPF